MRRPMIPVKGPTGSSRGLLFLLISLLTLGVLAVAPAHAACTGASPKWNATADEASIRACINNAVTGDTVNVSAGSFTSSNGLVIDGKNITLHGAGIDQTVINGQYAVFNVDIADTASRVTGFTFNLGGVLSGYRTGSASLNNDWRVDHNKFVGSGGHQEMVTVKCSDAPTGGQHCRGLVDHNTFLKGGFPQAKGMNANVNMHRAWALPTNLGSPNALYVEDNTFIWVPNVDGPDSCVDMIDMNYGGRAVVRFNTLRFSCSEIHSLASDVRASRSWEIYKNTNTGNGWTSGLIRGGTGIVWGNTWITGSDGRPVSPYALDNVRSFEGPPGDKHYGECNGGSSADGNTISNGYPCRDQIGRGQDAGLTQPSCDDGTNTGCLGVTNATRFQPQALEPVYFVRNYDNTGAIVPVDLRDGLYGNTENGCTTCSPINPIALNRDVYLEVTGFNGTKGVGTGPIASRPSACTTGVGYWATDQGSWNTSGNGQGNGVLYKCIATNTWSLYYVPYTYPHPLAQGSGAPPAGGGGTPPAPPSAPTNLVIN
jgi:hypothetical protein